MATKFLNGIDANGKQILNMRLQNLAAHPSGKAIGFIYFNTADLAAYQLQSTGPDVWTNLSISGTNLSIKETTATTVEIDSDTGSNAVILEVTTTRAGVMTAADKTKLNGIAAGAQVNVGTNLEIGTVTNLVVPITSSTGTGAIIPTATTTTAGVMSGTDKTKLNGIEAGAQANVATNLGIGSKTSSTLNVTSSTGSAATVPAATTTEAGLLTATDKTKLDGIASGAQVNVATNLGIASKTATTFNITSSTGSAATAPAATTTEAGLLTAADKTKLDGIATGAQVNVATNLGYTAAVNQGTVTSSTGTSATLPLADSTNAGLFTAAEKTKLSGIEAGADVTDATNVDAAGAVMNSDTTTASMSFVIDEDSMTSDLATKVPTQQSVKAYVDAQVSAVGSGALVNKGGYNASTNTPDLDTTPSGSIKNGWTYVVTAAGTFFTEPLQIGDMLIAKQDAPTTLAHWTLVNKNIPDIVSASDTAQGIIELATQAEVNTGTDAARAVTPATLKSNLGLGTGMSVARKYSANVGDGSAVSIAVTHNFASKDVSVTIREVSTDKGVYVDWTATDTNTVTLTFDDAPTSAQYRVTIIG